ncbi:Gfo/Idh/MocA family protein [Prosthecochloris sp. GSB1]|uniref:Gfo/Idh/MocA family protein n=1 Tax=Prosthecochloris sp. GSB1 TaxID=281093 RepID=UPI002696B32B
MTRLPLKIGFVGSGWARIAQAPAFAILDGVELAAISSPTRHRREKFRDLFGIPHAFENWQDLMRSDLDLVCITSPPDLHREMALSALASGKSILCEKPMALTVEEASEMVGAAGRSGSLALIDHELRFHPAVRQMKLMIESGEIGRLYEIRSVVTLASRNRPDLPYSWWCEESRGGGALGAIGSHLIDLARFLVGEISDVSCDLVRHIPVRPDHDGNPRKVTSDDGFSLRITFGPSSLAFGGPCCCNVTTVSGYTSFAFEAVGSLKTVMFDGAGKLREVRNGAAKGGAASSTPRSGVRSSRSFPGMNWCCRRKYVSPRWRFTASSPSVSRFSRTGLSGRCKAGGGNWPTRHPSRTDWLFRKSCMRAGYLHPKSAGWRLSEACIISISLGKIPWKSINFPVGKPYSLLKYQDGVCHVRRRFADQRSA